MTNRVCADRFLRRAGLVRVVARACVLAGLVAVGATSVHAASDIVLYASDAHSIHGNWSQAASASGAGSAKMASSDYGWSQLASALPGPNDYFEMSFNAPAYTSYHVWLRLRATNDSKYNDSVWVQFSDAVTLGGSPVYSIGSGSALLVNLENCAGCGESGWGWQDKAYWLSQPNVIQFTSSGSHTIRVQIREDGVAVDQVVLSPSTYFSSAPGSVWADSTILPESTGSSGSSGGGGSSSSNGGSSNSGGNGSSASPFNGSPASIPGTIEAENYDYGPSGVSYWDSTPGNNGGQFRGGDVDIERSSDGGYDVGWIAAGEWLNYTVNVQSAGSYTVQLRVASPNGGGSLHIGFNNSSSVWKSVSIPATGGWQTWTTVTVPVTLGAGTQQMTLAFDTNGFNIASMNVVQGGSGSSSGSSGGSTPAPSYSGGSGGTLTVFDWNIQVDDWGAGHASTAMDYAMNLSPTPQVVVIEEAHASQYQTYINELQNRTGVTWRGTIQTHCSPGAWNGSSCSSYDDEGVAIFTSLPVVDSGGKLLTYADQWHSARGAARLAVSLNGTTVQVFGVHLQVDATARYQSMAMFKSWASNYSTPQIVGGDFNADMDQIDTTSGMLPNFVDTWPVVGSGSYFTAFSPNPSMKLDYWFTDAGWRAQPVWSVVIANAGTFSDHYGVMTQFTVR